MTAMHICRPASVTFRRVLACPTCKQRRRMVVDWAIWYGLTATCCGCGDTWSDGWRHPRPALRGWRATASARARQRWAEAPARAEANAEMKRMLDFEFEGVA